MGAAFPHIDARNGRITMPIKAIHKRKYNLISISYKPNLLKKSI